MCISESYTLTKTSGLGVFTLGSAAAWMRYGPQDSGSTGTSSRKTPDVAYQTTHGWIFDDATGTIWAGGFDLNDEPIPQP